jgi:MerR family transcriptional regulator/heat shock protein HspR
MAKRPRRAGRTSKPDPAGDRAVYIISVAAELAGVHPQTLRIYERKGLLSPARTAGNTRRYSDRDLQRLRLIQRLTQDEGINLAGVKMIVEMENELERMRLRVQSLHRDLERARRQMQEELQRTAREARRAEIVPLATIQRLRLLTAAPGAARGGEG